MAHMELDRELLNDIGTRHKEATIFTCHEGECQGGRLRLVRQRRRWERRAERIYAMFMI